MDGVPHGPVPWPLTLALATLGVCSGGWGYGTWALAAARAAAEHPAVQEVAAAGALRAAATAARWTHLAPWCYWAWAGCAAVGISMAGLAFGCGALCGTALGWTGGRWSRAPPPRATLHDAHAALAQRLLHGGQAAVRTAAAELDVHPDAVSLWFGHWEAAASGPRSAALRRRLAEPVPEPLF